MRRGLGVGVLALVSLSAIACGGTNAGRPDAGPVTLLPENDPGSGPFDCSADDGVEESLFSDFEAGAATGGWYLNNDVCDQCTTLLAQALAGGTATETPKQLEADLEGCNVRCGASQTPGINEKPLPSDEIKPSARCGSHFALHVRGGPFTNWGGVIGIQFPPAHPLDASAWTGIAFWGRVAPDSRTTFRLQVSERHTDGKYPNPVCVDTAPDGESNPRDSNRDGCDRFGSYAILSSDWQFFKIRFDEMQQGGWGVAAPFLDLTTMLTIEFQYPQGSWDIWLDDVALYREKAQ